ncbi:MAG: nucleoside-diphosphate sugar epimerase/dehydratase [Anaerolineae bacterium]
MTLSKRHQRTMEWAGVDIVTVCAAYTMIFAARTVITPLDYINSFPYIVWAAFFMVMVSYLFGVYKRIWSRTSGHGITVIIKSVVVSTICIVLYCLASQPRPLPISIPLLGNILALAGFTAVRYRSRLASGFAWRWKAIWDREFPRPQTRVLIIGAGESGQALTWRLKHRNPGSPYEIIGFIDDDPEKQKMFVEGSPVLGTREDIVAMSNLHKVDLIVVAIHNISGQDFRTILSLCEQTSAVVKVAPDLFAMVNATTNAPSLRDVRPEDLIGRSTISRRNEMVKDELTNKVVCVTGAAGSIGSELSRQIMAYCPSKVILIDNNESGLHDLVTELTTAYPRSVLVPILADITIVDLLETVFDRHRPEIVFHAAAYKHVPMLESHPHEALRVNIRGTKCVAELSYRYHVERFVLISTDKAVKPASIMGASKRVCELILHRLSQQHDCTTLFTAVRFGNVLGSRGSVVPTFNQQIDNGGPVTVTHPDMTRYFMSISEAVNLIIHSAGLTEGDDIFMLRMGEVVRIVELAERMIRMRGLRPYKDIEIKFTGIRPGEKMHEELFDSREKSIPTAHPHIVRIQSWEQDSVMAGFGEQLDRFLSNPPLSPPDIMSALSQLSHVSSGEALTA